MGTKTLLTTYCLVNLSPFSAIDFKNPYEIWFGQATNYRNMRAFDCSAYAHVSQRKLALRALRGFFITYSKGVKGYKIWCTYLNHLKCSINSSSMMVTY